MATDYQNDRLSQIAAMLQEKQMTDMRFGMDTVEIQEATGLAIASIYRDVQSTAAKQWGINKTIRNKRPYQYYVDVDALVSHQSYLRQFGEQKVKPKIKEFPNDTAKQALFDYITTLTIQMINENPDAKGTLTMFQRNMTKVLTPKELVSTWETNTVKVATGMLLGFTNMGVTNDAAN